jgi:hypothetical protein
MSTRKLKASRRNMTLFDSIRRARGHPATNPDQGKTMLSYGAMESWSASRVVETIAPEDSSTARQVSDTSRQHQIGRDERSLGRNRPFPIPTWWRGTGP